MSSFRRVSAKGGVVPPKPTQDTADTAQQPLGSTLFPGTKRWVDGSLLTSTGHAGFDGLLGGGLPIGGLVCLDADSSYTHASALASLYLAQGIASGHCITFGAHVAGEMDAFVRGLPLNVSRNSSDAVAVAGRDSAASEDTPAKPTLTIAHSYAKYLGAAPAKDDSRFCNTFDMNRHIPAESIATASINALPLTPLPNPETVSLTSKNINRVYLHKLGDEMNAFSLDVSALHSLAGGFSSMPARLLGGTFGLDGSDPEYGLPGHSATSRHLQLKLFLVALKRKLMAADASPAVIVVSMRLSQFAPAIAAELRAIFDIVIKVHSFSDPACDIGLHSRFAGDVSAMAAGTAKEFQDCQGLLLIRKLSRPGRGIMPRSDGLIYTIKRDKRKIVLEKPHLPPEEPSTEAAQPSMSCQSSVGVASASTLDF